MSLTDHVLLQTYNLHLSFLFLFPLNKRKIQYQGQYQNIHKSRQSPPKMYIPKLPQAQSEINSGHLIPFKIQISKLLTLQFFLLQDRIHLNFILFTLILIPFNLILLNTSPESTKLRGKYNCGWEREYKQEVIWKYSGPSEMWEKVQRQQ